jgi:hypothetical protein
MTNDSSLPFPRSHSRANQNKRHSGNSLMRWSARPSSRLLAILAVGALVGIGFSPRNLRATGDSGSQIIEGIANAFKSTPALLKSARNNHMGGIDLGRSRSTRQSNDSFRMHAGLDRMTNPPGLLLALLEEQRTCL